jgi:hypothetical protein
MRTLKAQMADQARRFRMQPSVIDPSMPFFCEHFFFFRLTKKAAQAASNHPGGRIPRKIGIGRSCCRGLQELKVEFCSAEKGVWIWNVCKAAMRGRVGGECVRSSLQWSKHWFLVGNACHHMLVVRTACCFLAPKVRGGLGHALFSLAREKRAGRHVIMIRCLQCFKDETLFQ